MKRFGKKLAVMMLILAMVMSLVLATPAMACDDETSQPFAGLVTINDPVLGTQQIYMEIQGNHEEALVYINGYSSDSPEERALDAALVNALKATGKYNVVSFDRPGLGQSPASVNPRTAENKAKELYLALQEKGFHKVNFIAHSAGGFEVTEMLNMHPNFVKKVVAIDTTHPDALFDLRDTLSTYWLNVNFMGMTWPSVWDIFKAFSGFNPLKDGSYEDLEASATHSKTILQNNPDLYEKTKMRVLSASIPGVYTFIADSTYGLGLTENLDQAIALDDRQVNQWQPDYENWGPKITQETVPNTTHYVWATPEGLARVLEVTDDLIN